MSYSPTVKNVKEWAYMQMLHGKQVNPLHLISMFDREQKQRSEKLFSDLLKVSQQIAVDSKLLTKHKKTKYKERRIQIGLHSYYLFHRHYIPADIYVILKEIREDTYIYSCECED